MLHKLEFSRNWNEKLNNNIFQTIRKKNHPIKMGDQVDIYLQGKYIKRVVCIADTQAHFVDISVAQLAIDTGYWGDAAKQIFRNFGINVDDPAEIVTLLFFATMNSTITQTKNDIKNQASLF